MKPDATSRDPLCVTHRSTSGGGHLPRLLMTFIEMLEARWKNADSLLCVGLDPNPSRFPDPIAGKPDAIYEFCTGIVDATAHAACAFKPQIAYFASSGAEAALEAVIAYIHEKHPGIPVILDAKRGDIGSTAEHYAREAFERFKADCVTLSPFMGHDTIAPYLAYGDKGAFVLCRTSNKGGDDLQMLDVNGMRLYEYVARLVAETWNSSGQLGLVVGATYPHEIANVRRIAPTLPLLVPGIGAQGGDIRAAVEAGQRADGLGMVINSGRAIIYASKGEDWQAAAKAAAEATRDAINAARR